MPCNASYARFIFGKFFTSTIILYALLFAQKFYSYKKWVLQCHTFSPHSRALFHPLLLSRRAWITTDLHRCCVTSPPLLVLSWAPHWLRLITLSLSGIRWWDLVAHSARGALRQRCAAAWKSAPPSPRAMEPAHKIFRWKIIWEKPLFDSVLQRS
jgi:hypothetical protein